MPHLQWLQAPRPGEDQALPVFCTLIFPQPSAPRETHVLLLTWEVPAGLWQGAGTWGQTSTSSTPLKSRLYLRRGGVGVGEVLILKLRGQPPLGVEMVKFTLSYTLVKLRSNFTHTGLHTLDSIRNSKVAPN